MFLGQSRHTSIRSGSGCSSGSCMTRSGQSGTDQLPLKVRALRTAFGSFLNNAIAKSASSPGPPFDDRRWIGQLKSWTRDRETDCWPATHQHQRRSNAVNDTEETAGLMTQAALTLFRSDPSSLNNGEPSLGTVDVVLNRSSAYADGANDGPINLDRKTATVGRDPRQLWDSR
jgi:hypothetical protein